MIDSLAVFPPAIVFQISDSDAQLSPFPIPQETSLPSPLIHPDQSPVPTTDIQDLQSISAALAQSIIGTSLIAQSLVQGGTKPRLDTEPSRPDEQPFVPQNLPLESVQPNTRKAASSPGISILTPSAYGQSWGSASIGVGLQSRTRFTRTSDGVVGIGLGLGDAQKTVGLDLGLTFVDLIGNTAQDGSVSLKLHRRLPEDFAVAVGVKNLIRFGATDSGTGYYGVVTKRFILQEDVQQPFSQIFVSAGVGSGQFRSELDINEDRTSVGVFGSVAVRVAEPISAIAEWSGQDLTLGLSIAPFRDVPLVVTPAITDITGKAGDGSRFILGIGYGISF
ncbi:hypothetical protein [Allocoleopsis franciscana]|uniref:Uncharacterized protein n=1 Tax=Allocoleopsis franciscana PCC 7113 TaxID=1173027 RepID=K9WM12_9CYAN|nr:hypothetical protein [Allocoleopsis franciscana]AFZ21450.1 hypothetical protein Mic7113_5832 [Allocoleopsis franciscana PCC 7113]